MLLRRKSNSGGVSNTALGLVLLRIQSSHALIQDEKYGNTLETTTYQYKCSLWLINYKDKTYWELVDDFSSSYLEKSNSTDVALFLWVCIPTMNHVSL